MSKEPPIEKVELNKRYEPGMKLTAVKLHDLVEYLEEHPRAMVVGTLKGKIS